ncbi:MAG: DUF3782 domain-containing protein [Candidatus Binatia bacterium]|nr:DUF3782 domain-containing protein [Candidatus Binatia bacterium]
MPYTEIIEEFPPELRRPIARLVDALREELGVGRADFAELKAIVRDLAEAQRELAEAQQRTELRVEELAEAQRRTELRVEELAQAQKELTQAQKRMEDELTLFRRTFTAQIGGLGARWGLQSEEAFRQGMRAVLQEVGYTAERFLDYDAQGEVFGYPEQIELDVIVTNGKVMVLEIKSSLSKGDVYYFARKAAFYARKTGRQVDRKLIVTPYAETQAKEVGMRVGVEICTDVNALG